MARVKYRRVRGLHGVTMELGLVADRSRDAVHGINVQTTNGGGTESEVVQLTRTKMP